MDRRGFLIGLGGLAAAIPLTNAPTASATTVRVNGCTISGAIYDLWRPNRSVVGLPQSNEYAITGGTKQRFENAAMYSSRAGAGILRGHLRATFAEVGGVSVLGTPLGVQQRDGVRRTNHQECTGGSLWWSAADGGKAVPAAKTVPLWGARNFRDAAGTGRGLAVAGGRMKRNVLYRSNRLHDLSAMDVSILRDLGVRRILDLRRPSAIAASEDRALVDATTRVIDVFGATRTSSSLDSYRAFVSSSYRRARIGEAITDIAHATTPLIVHCTHGKDRTGWTIAMIQLGLGASVSDVTAQWLLSNASLGTSTLTLDLLNAGLAEIRSRYGTVEKYLTRGLGLSTATREALVRRLVR